ncbi:protein HUA2-LIKE 2 [Iris pallida]|uniref:Protein HUA2-LIKE 2 n=1 Tax=Iris pallida TaxID=29817 RepID=A0AAX6E4T6_IRIPA|nr:protein HUA2-LIKE 2 [Iris pallida]
MAPSRRRGSQRAAAAAARRQWNVGDLVLAKMKGFPAWPAVVSEPEKWGYSSSDRRKLLVYFYGTKQIAFCNYADIEAFTEEKKKSLLTKRQGKGSDFVRAVEEIIDIYETTKKQSLVEANLRDEGMESNSANSEGSRSKSLRKSPEISSRVTDNNQSEALLVSTETHDVVADEPQMVSGDRHNTSAISSDPTEKVSILDELRQTPLSATTTRKRLRDGSLQRSVRQRVPSLRRSRSSSGGDSYKLQKSTMTLSDADLSSKDLVPDLVEEPADKNKLAEVVGHVSGGCNGVADASDGLTINGCSRDNVSDIAAVESEKEGGMVESSCKLATPVDRDSNPGFSGGGRLNGKLDTPTKAVILKKKRGSHRKRVTPTRESDTLDTAAVNIELHESRSESPITHKERNEKFSKADGDEHLPLVKRARVRMEKPSLEEKQLEDFVGNREKLEIETPVDDFDKFPTYSSPVNGSPGSRTTRIKKVASSLPTNGCTLNEGTDPILWKVNKYQLKGITVDVEAALPPSKRLHRALEAMSANAAEATVDIPEVAGDVELVSNGCTEMPKSNSVHLLAAENILCSATSPHVQSCDNTSIQNDESGLPSSFTSHNLEVSMLASSLVEHDNALPKSLSSPHDKDCKEMLPGVRDCSGSFTSEIAVTDIHEKVLQPCTFKSIEKERSSTFTEVLHCQLSSPFGGKDGNKTLKPAREPSFPRRDVVGENGMVEPLVKLDCILSSKENGDLLPTDETALASFSGCVGPVASKSSESTKSPGSLTDESIQSKDMQDDVKQAKHRAAMKYWGISSDIAPMKDLIAAAQAKRLLSRSTSFPDNVVDGKHGFDDALSPSVGNKEDSSVRGSPPSTGLYHRPASDDGTHQLHNDSRSPLAGQRQKGLNKLTLQGEANVARRSFEALLCTLSRTKESIGRATRVAIDCAKYGIAAEAIEILLQYLERESSMYKKIDLFFLVDSITQWSRNQKGGAGDVYLSLVQSILPRLLSAAAPPGHGAWENRKQCLKASTETMAREEDSPRIRGTT